MLSSTVILLVAGCLLGGALAGTASVSDEVTLNVMHGDSLTFQCSPPTDSILLLSANYIQPETTTPAPKKKGKGSDTVEPVAWCPSSSAITVVGPACDAKKKCTVKAQDAGKERGCSKRPLRIRYKCVASARPGSPSGSVRSAGRR
ncbi:uncharacterized protein LOC129590875 [Paramacrobiotus metropolitanus]|uniref:uncharacterized protein LOC129590875 n=1 Tax=Paramacrobiotus metropolitanus TaxID=2943436 RepID=UPI002445B9FA|nr:uncharacterized protein LOC129590875 [Paramacrobiotus metropolitanus]